MSVLKEDEDAEQDSTEIYFCPDRRCVERIVPSTESDLVECRFCGARWRTADLITTEFYIDGAKSPTSGNRQLL